MKLVPDYKEKYLWFFGVFGTPKESSRGGDDSVRGNADRGTFQLLTWYELHNFCNYSNINSQLHGNICGKKKKLNTISTAGSMTRSSFELMRISSPLTM